VNATNWVGDYDSIENAVSPTVIENSPHYFPFFPGDIPVTMKNLEYGFRKSLFGANTGQIINVH
jgi:hypothetical protein